MAKIPTVLARKEVANFSKIGDVVSSMLSEAEFQAERDGTWILMDGRDVIGSDYAILKTGDAVTSHNIPDARGQFLRGLDPSGTVDPEGATRTLGDSQGHSTALPNNPWTTSNSGNHRHSEGSGGNATNLSYNKFAGASGTTYNTVYTDYAGAHTHTISGGDAESRPKNITVNHFIKIYH
jgi:hypothetical protein